MEQSEKKDGPSSVGRKEYNDQRITRFAEDKNTRDLSHKERPSQVFIQAFREIR